MRLKKFIISSLSAVMIATSLVGCSMINKEKETEDATSLVGCSMINKEKETEEPVSDLVNVTLLTDAEGGAGESLISSAREGLDEAESGLGIDGRFIKCSSKDDIKSNIEVLVKGGKTSLIIGAGPRFESIEAESGLGIDGRFIKCSSKDDIKSNIEVLVKGGKTSLIIGAGPRFESIISVYAQKYPEQDFAIIDGTINGEIPKNLTTVTFDDERSGFIAGFIAGKMTAKNKVGYISGVSGSSEKAYKQGFEKGLKKANDKNPEIVSRNVNIYESYEDAKNAFVDVEYYGADILFSPTEDDSKAAIDSINSNYSKVIAVNKDQYHYSKDKVVASITKSYSKAVYDLCAMVYDGGESYSNYSKVIAVNKDQYHYSKDKVVASITKSYSKAVYDLCAMVYDGGESFKGGKNTQYGVAEKTIALSPSTENTVPPDVLSSVYDLCAMVYDGGESFKGGKNTQYGVAEKTIALSPSTENTVPPDVLSSLSKALKEEYSSGK